MGLVEVLDPAQPIRAQPQPGGQTADIWVEASRDNDERLHLVLPKANESMGPTHWAFGQLASIVGTPASYLRQLPAPLAGINLPYGLAASLVIPMLKRFIATGRAFARSEGSLLRQRSRLEKTRLRRSPGRVGTEFPV